jgi:hypothetical protein
MAAPPGPPAPQPSLENMPPMAFYVAKGPPDACGAGCDTWIAVEGTIDGAAAGRFRKFLRQQRAGHLPIYVSSPGGNLEHALAMGRMLRETPTVARVARTIVGECGPEAQAGEPCLKLKRSGRVLGAELSAQGAMCNSACPYLILGATTREIAPNTVMAIHSPKVILSVKWGKPTEEQRAQARAQGIDRANRMIASYLDKMGVNRGLLDLARTVKFESMHILSRDEIARFGIDRREFAETPWRFESNGRSVVSKTVVAKKTGSESFRTTQWRLFCEGKDRVRLMAVREFDKDAAGKSSVALVAGSDKPPSFGAIPARVGAYEVWTAAIAADAIKKRLALSRIEVGENTLLPDGKLTQAMFAIETGSLESAWTRLATTCATAPGSIKHLIEMPKSATPPSL